MKLVIIYQFLDLYAIAPTFAIDKLTAIITSIGLGLIGVLIGGFKKVFKKEKFRSMLYAIITALLFSIAALFASAQVFSFSLFYIFISCQAFFLLLGIIHVVVLPKILKWPNKDENSWVRIVFSLCIIILSTGIFSFSFKFIRPEYYNLYLLGSLILFIIPLLIYESFEAAMSIPTKIYKNWEFPIHQVVPPPKSEEMNNLILIALELNKRNRTLETINFRVKAPEHMSFEHFFYHFIQEYNTKHPEDQIEIESVTGKASTWIFYKKQKWYQIFTRFIEPEETVKINKIKENNIIICERS